MSYHTLLEKWWRQGMDDPRRWHSSRLSMDYEVEAFGHPDFDVPGVLVTTPSGRVMVIIEGEKEFVGPIIEKAREQFDALNGATA